MKLKFLTLTLTLSTGIVHADPTIYFEAPNGHDYDSMSVEIQVDSMTKQKGEYVYLL